MKYENEINNKYDSEEYYPVEYCHLLAMSPILFLLCSMASKSIFIGYFTNLFICMGLFLIVYIEDEWKNSGLKEKSVAICMSILLLSLGFFIIYKRVF